MLKVLSSGMGWGDSTSPSGVVPLSLVSGELLFSLLEGVAAAAALLLLLLSIVAAGVVVVVSVVICGDFTVMVKGQPASESCHQMHIIGD